MKPADPTRRTIAVSSVAISAVLAAISMGFYQVFGWLVYRTGFPLDDAWIHQTYARNLALHGEWSFILGQPSAGSTSPLWSLLLVPGQLMRLNPVLWSLLLGWLTLTGLMVVSSKVIGDLLPGEPRRPLWIGLFLGLEWHLVWAAASGMETAAYSLVALLVLGWLVKTPKSWFWPGALVGAAAWLRPDGITLLAPVTVVLLLGTGTVNARLRQLVDMGVGFCLLFVPYMLFNRWLAGAWWPNTFFAKQAEYAIELQAPLVSRLIEQAILPLVGAGAVLLPGFIGLVIRAIRQKQWAVLAGALWAAGYMSLYAVRLPVTYQHGRYVIPMMPVYFTWGLAGMIAWLQLSSFQSARRIISRAWMVSLLVVLLLFWGLGARAFGNDVAFIESEMVDTAHWVAHNTQPDDLLAAHDIGALGYFGGRRLVDLAGLVSAEVIPFIRDESQLASYLDTQRVDYLAIFPGWYEQLSSEGELVYRSPGRYAVEQGYENMVVYRWHLAR